MPESYMTRKSILCPVKITGEPDIDLRDSVPNR